MKFIRALFDEMSPMLCYAVRNRGKCNWKISPPSLVAQPRQAAMEIHYAKAFRSLARSLHDKRKKMLNWLFINGTMKIMCCYISFIISIWGLMVGLVYVRQLVFGL